MSNKSSQDNDYEMAKFLAEAIGLADHPPVNLKNNAFVVNTITRKQKERKLHQSDFKHLED